MTDQDSSTSVQEEFEELRESLKTLQLATLDSDGQPLASYAPYVRFEQKYYLYLSELAKHTVNLIANGSVGLLFIESEESSRNLFARRRIVLQGEVRTIERDSPLFTLVIAEFERQFGGIIKVIEPLQDFHLFQINPVSGRFIRGFAEAFEMSGPGLDVIEHIGADKLWFSLWIIEAAYDSGTDMVVTPCPLCQTNVEIYQDEKNAKYGSKFEMPVVYYSELNPIDYGRSSDRAAFDGQIIKTRQLEEIAAK